jgi:hypothetical protein
VSRKEWERGKENVDGWKLKFKLRKIVIGFG